ncbi:MAG: DUF523 and DUF1722 domain-containing protein [Syntrophales bacterium]|nr:DUF523 and DUF1722 domain-containing protein [Syntrophales bacterium]MDD5533390.1 DUF523 and DUF1722 domain-containing protein [Syntrophales bacterium]
MEKIRLGVSSCLLGESVRYDGGHRLDSCLSGNFGAYAEFVPVCPEVECGFGVPREPMRLEGEPERPRLVSVRTGRDLTDQFVLWASRRVEELGADSLDGFVFKSGSPSCGVFRSIIRGESGARRRGSGIFARLFAVRHPLVPVEEEGRLHDPELRENFIERIFLLRRWRDRLGSGRSRAGLTDFHARHKLLLLSHSERHCRIMGRIAAGPGTGIDAVYSDYEKNLLQAAAAIPTARKHVNVLMHAMGYFKREIAPDEKQEFLERLGDYREGRLPLIVPLTIVRHYIQKYGQEYLGRQWYFYPDPLELMLRYHS